MQQVNKSLKFNYGGFRPIYHCKIVKSWAFYFYELKGHQLWICKDLNSDNAVKISCSSDEANVNWTCVMRAIKDYVTTGSIKKKD